MTPQERAAQIVQECGTYLTARTVAYFEEAIASALSAEQSGGLSLSIEHDPLAVSDLLADGTREREMYHRLIADIRRVLGEDGLHAQLLDLPKVIASALSGKSPSAPPLNTAATLREICVKYHNALCGAGMAGFFNAKLAEEADNAFCALEEASALSEPRFAWLMERRLTHDRREWNRGYPVGTLVYWDGGHAESFTTDVNLGVQWCRREDALRCTSFTKNYAQWGWGIVEHGFMGASALSNQSDYSEAQWRIDALTVMVVAMRRCQNRHPHEFCGVCKMLHDALMFGGASALSEPQRTTNDKDLTRRDGPAPIEAPQPALTDWMPIATVPKDGSSILVSFQSIGVYQVFWSEQPYGEGIGSWCVTDNKNEDRPLRGYPSEADATLWMPVPVPDTKGSERLPRSGARG